MNGFCWCPLPIASRNIKLERLPTLAHLLHANSCVSRRNLLPVVHVAWFGWHGGTVRNSEHLVLNGSLQVTRCPVGDLIHWKSLRGRRFNCGLDPRGLGGGDVCGSAAAFPLRQVIGCDTRLWRQRLRLLLLAHCYGHLALNLFLQSLIV